MGGDAAATGTSWSVLKALGEKQEGEKGAGKQLL